VKLFKNTYLYPFWFSEKKYYYPGIPDIYLKSFLRENKKVFDNFQEVKCFELWQ